MTTRKSKSRAARKRRAQAAGVDASVASAFREVDEALTREYLAAKQFLRTAQERLIVQLEDTFWRDAKFLKRCREEVGLSQAALAEAIGISRLVIANYETGVSVPAADSAYKIYQALDALGNVDALRAKVEIGNILFLVGRESREVQQGRLELTKEFLNRLDAHLAQFGTELEKDKTRLLELAARITGKGRRNGN